MSRISTGWNGFSKDPKKTSDIFAERREVEVTKLPLANGTTALVAAKDFATLCRNLNGIAHFELIDKNS